MAAESLRQNQSRFARALPKLLLKAEALGYAVTLGECLRSDEQAEINALGEHGRERCAQVLEREFPLLAAKIRNNGKWANGIRDSLHCYKLAIDLNLFDAQGRWIQDSGPYAELGAYWKSLGADHRYGGDFGDTPHYSIEHGGRQ